MPESRPHRRARRGTLVLAAAAAALAGLIGAQGAGAGSGSRIIELGKTARTPPPACPNPCSGIVKVTGFQRRTGGTGGTRNPFISPVTGRIVAWSITTSRPSNSQRHFFNTQFGSPPTARIGVLRKTDSAPVPKYQLLRQSPREELGEYLGEKTIFTLREPIHVAQGQIVALTIPTWAPALGFGLTSKNTWRASRAPGKCDTAPGAPGAQASRPHQDLDAVRRYACNYTTDRLLYTAFIATNQ